MIYMLKTDDNIALKVGFTKSRAAFSNRLHNLQTSNHRTLQVIYLGSGTMEMEGLIHGFLEPYSLRGEWYDLSHNSIQEFIKDCQKIGLYGAYWLWHPKNEYTIGFSLKSEVFRTKTGTVCKDDLEKAS